MPGSEGEEVLIFSLDLLHHRYILHAIGEVLEEKENLRISDQEAADILNKAMRRGEVGIKLSGNQLVIDLRDPQREP